MCFANQSAPPPAPAVTPAPTREEIMANEAKRMNERKIRGEVQKEQAEEDAAEDTINIVEETKAKLSRRQGSYANIATSRSGDSGYSEKAKMARFGGSKKPTKFGQAA